MVWAPDSLIRGHPTLGCAVRGHLILELPG